MIRIPAKLLATLTEAFTFFLGLSRQMPRWYIETRHDLLIPDPHTLDILLYVSIPVCYWYYVTIKTFNTRNIPTNI
jgi:hypothetical protein